MATLKKIVEKEAFRSLKLFNFLISSILGLFFGCKTNPVIAAYGVPSAAYKISGTIISSDQNTPVKGLSVSIRDTAHSTWILDSAKTDSSGKYTLQFSGCVCNQEIDLKAEDIDSTENGEYITKDTLFSISQNNPKDSKGIWHAGIVEKTVDMKVDRKN
jgi:putative lipoprotein (rSAM/lipoprotein system)